MILDPLNDGVSAVELIQHVGSDLMVAAAARVSTGAEVPAEVAASEARLIRYLLRHHHGTPFEQRKSRIRRGFSAIISDVVLGTRCLQHCPSATPKQEAQMDTSTSWGITPYHSAYHYAVAQAVQSGYHVDAIAGVVYGRRGSRMNTKQHCGSGYPTLSLRIEGKGYTVQLHKMIAYAVWGDYVFAPGVVVRHLDSDRENNTISNLALGSYKDNADDIPSAVRARMASLISKQRKGQPSKKRGLSPEQVREIESTYIPLKVNGRLPSGLMAQIVERYGVSNVTIRKALRGSLYD